MHGDTLIKNERKDGSCHDQGTRGGRQNPLDYFNPFLLSLVRYELT